MESTQLPGDPGPCPAGLALQAWNLMGGMEWQAIPVVAEILGVRDIEGLVTDLAAIRDFQNRSN